MLDVEMLTYIKSNKFFVNYQSLKSHIDIKKLKLL